MEPLTISLPEYLDAVSHDFEGYAKFRAVKLHLGHVPFEDRAQIMRIAIMRAAVEFRGDAFLDRPGFLLYANYYIDTETNRLLASYNLDYTLARNAVRAFVLAYRLRMARTLPATVEEFRALLPGWKASCTSALKAALEAGYRESTRSLDFEAGEDDDHNYHDSIGRDDERYAQADTQMDVEFIVERARRGLGPRYFLTFLLYHGLDDPATFPEGRAMEQVGALLGITRAAVSLRVIKAHERLRKLLGVKQSPESSAEKLVCVDCGAEFHRRHVRGARPSRCSPCQHRRKRRLDRERKGAGVFTTDRTPTPKEARP